MFTYFNKFISTLYALGLIVLLTALDQVSKYKAVLSLKEQNDFIIIKNVFQLHYLENDGAAFSMLKGQQGFFLTITPILLLVLLYLIIRMPKDKKFVALDYIIVFVIAGAIGNYIDRIRFGYVVDFFYFSLIDFPVFNVADIYVTCSVILLFILILFYYKESDFDLIKDNLFKKKEK